MTDMRLATFNILHGRTVRDGKVEIARLREAVRMVDADILALQEVDRDQPRSHHADLTAVAAEAMGAVSSRFVAALAGTPGATWTAATGKEAVESTSYGIALLSRYPARSWQVSRLPRIPFRFPMYFPGSRRVGIVREEPRAVVIGEFDTPLGPLVVANAHLSFVPGWNRLQLARVRRDLAVFNEPALLMGDLNMTPPGPVRITGYRALATRPTFPDDDPARQLDHVLVRGPFPDALRVDTPTVGVSDHRPLIVDVEG
jgi:endonuclease/exonuclease/phosphatase family metal-dependent hydrolase